MGSPTSEARIMRVLRRHLMVGFYRNIISGANKLFNWKPHSVSLHDLLIEILGVDGKEEVSA